MLCARHWSKCADPSYLIAIIIGPILQMSTHPSTEKGGTQPKVTQPEVTLPEVGEQAGSRTSTSTVYFLNSLSVLFHVQGLCSPRSPLYHIDYSNVTNTAGGAHVTLHRISCLLASAQRETSTHLFLPPPFLEENPLQAKLCLLPGVACLPSVLKSKFTFQTPARVGVGYTSSRRPSLIPPRAGKTTLSARLCLVLSLPHFPASLFTCLTLQPRTGPLPSPLTPGAQLTSNEWRVAPGWPLCSWAHPHMVTTVGL